MPDFFVVERKPIGVAAYAWTDGVNGGERCVVVCDDGAVFVENPVSNGGHWQELPAVPGTLRAARQRGEAGA